MDLEKAYDKVDKSKLFVVLKEYEIEEKVLKGVRAF